MVDLKLCAIVRSSVFFEMEWKWTSGCYWGGANYVHISILFLLHCSLWTPFNMVH